MEFVYKGDKNIIEYEIPDGYKSITNDCFLGCFKLEKIILPSSIKIIGGYAFWKCESLKEINIPNGCEEIHNGAFADCENLSKINIPESCGYIGREAFRDCYELEKIIIPPKSKSIYPLTFQNCCELKEITLNCNFIDGYAFSKCMGLRCVKIIGENVTVDSEAFSESKTIDLILDCENIEGLRIRAKNAYIPHNLIGKVNAKNKIVTLQTLNGDFHHFELKGNGENYLRKLINEKFKQEMIIEGNCLLYPSS